MKLDIRHGRWQDTLAERTMDANGDAAGLIWSPAKLGLRAGGALIFDAPYSKRTHASETTRADGAPTEGLAPAYSYLTEQDVELFCAAWADFPGWMVSITDDVLAPVRRACMADEGRYSFAPVPIVMPGMSVRIQGDGPSSWAVYAMVSRPRTKEFASWGTLPGAYDGPPSREAGGGRGKPDWLLRALVRDYSRKGDLVIDPFAGWGSTLTAALGLDRFAVGSEIDAAAIAEAQRRAGRGLQSDLFA